MGPEFWFSVCGMCQLEVFRYFMCVLMVAKQIKYGTNDLAIILVVLVYGLDRNTLYVVLSSIHELYWASKYFTIYYLNAYIVIHKIGT